MLTRVLLVDDDDHLIELMRAVLAANVHFEVVGEATDGETALRLAGEREPDLVVLDLGLPDLAGQEVLTRLRERSPATKVVVLTGDDVVDHSMLSEVEGFVSKVDELNRLVSVLEEVGAPRPESARLVLSVDSVSPRIAREFLSQVLSSWECAHVLDDAALVVSELVANAVAHARTESELRVQLRPGVLRVEVFDAGAGTPDPKAPSLDGEGGRGLMIVSALASAWGINPTADGKVVWAELAA